MNSIPARIATRTSDEPRSGCSMTRITAGPISRHAPRTEPRESRRPSRLPEVHGEHRDHQDLGELGELERERADRDPARRAADAVADGEGEHEQPEVDDVDRPDQRLEPAVVERRRGDEHDDRQAGPHEGPREDRAAVHDRLAGLDAVRVGHDQPEHAQQGRVGRELQVVGAPDRPDGPCGHIGEAAWLGPHHAHRGVS